MSKNSLFDAFRGDDAEPPVATIQMLPPMDGKDGEAEAGAGADESRKPEPPSLAETYEFHRKGAMVDMPIIYTNLGFKNWLDEADNDDLPEAAEEITMAQASRLLIRSVARLERANKRRVREEEASGPVCPATERIQDLTRERDQAADFYLGMRERLARIEHLESINRRSRAVPIPRQPARARSRKAATA